MEEPPGFENMRGRTVIARKHKKYKLCMDFFVLSSIFTELHNENQPYDLGTGSFGTVLGFPYKDDETKGVAVKKYLSPFLKAKNAQRCFRELHLLRKLRHENIIKMKFAYSVIEPGSREPYCVYLVTEYAGADLSQLLDLETQKKHKFTLRSFMRMIAELLRALKYLNSANVIHRDLKPSNLAITEAGKLTLLDFGMSRGFERNELLTSDSGTCVYRAIETIVVWDFNDTANNQRRMKVYDERSDMWSIGAILCEMITGDILFVDPAITRPPSAKDVIRKALQMCGPIPDNVISDNFVNEKDRAWLATENANARPRIDFGAYLRENCRSWLKDDIDANVENLADFIDQTLVFDKDCRMTVDKALDHPFLKSEKNEEKEVVAGFTIEDEEPRSTEEWQARIKDFIEHECSLEEGTERKNHACSSSEPNLQPSLRRSSRKRTVATPV